MDRNDFAFTCYRGKENEDIELLTTQDPATIRALLARFGIEEELAQDLKNLLTPLGIAKFVSVMLHHRPSPECAYAYTGVLEYGLQGLEKGYVVVLRSRSGDLDRIAAECDELHDFLAEKLTEAHRNNPEPVAQ